jgi:hypothetical protein
MATNAGTGLGIALGGRAKDFTQVEMAARRQKQLDEQKARQAKDKELEDVTKDIFVKPGQYLPMREAEVQREMAQYIKDMQEATGYGERMQRKFDFLSTVEKYKAEKQAFDKEYGSITSGKKISDDDVSVLITASNPDEVIQSATRGGIAQGSDGTFRITAYEAIDIPSRQSGLAARVRNEFQGRTVVGADGKTLNVLEPTPDDFRAQLASDFDQNLNVRANAARQYRDELDAMGLQGAQRIMKAKELYVERGLPFLTGSTVRGSGGMNINVRMGGEDGATPSMTSAGDVAVNVIQRSPSTGELETASFNFGGNRALGDAAATLSKGSEAYYIDTGEQVTDADIEKAVFNEFGYGLVLNKDVTLNTPKGKVEFKKGKPVTQGFETIAIQNGWAEPKMLVMANVNGKAMVADANRFAQSKAVSESKDKRPIVEANLNALSKDFDKFKRDFERRRAALLEQKNKRVSSQPKQTQSAAPKATTTQKKQFKNAPSGGFN